MSDHDALIARAEAFLVECGWHDAGLLQDCTCPPGDPRAVILDLVAALSAPPTDPEAPPWHAAVADALSDALVEGERVIINMPPQQGSARRPAPIGDETVERAAAAMWPILEPFARWPFAEITDSRRDRCLAAANAALAAAAPARLSGEGTRDA